jgi:hypothetical protein
MQAADYGFAEMTTMTFATARELEKRRGEAYNAVAGLIDRAKAAGRLRFERAIQRPQATISACREGSSGSGEC